MRLKGRRKCIVEEVLDVRYAYHLISYSDIDDIDDTKIYRLKE